MRDCGHASLPGPFPALGIVNRKLAAEGIFGEKAASLGSEKKKQYRTPVSFKPNN